MKARCRNCRTYIPYGDTYCEKCYSSNLKEKKKGLKDKQAETLIRSGAWKKVRAGIIRRDNGVCILCFRRGYIQFRNLQVHHIVKRTTDLSLAYDPSNLVTLCRTCHEEVEELPVAVQKEMYGDFNKEDSKEEIWRL